MWTDTARASVMRSARSGNATPSRDARVAEADDSRSLGSVLGAHHELVAVEVPVS